MDERDVLNIDADDELAGRLSSQEVAARYGVSRRSVARHCAQGRLPAEKCAGRWRVRLADAEAWAQSLGEVPALPRCDWQLHTIDGVQWVSLVEPCALLGLDATAELASLAARPWAVVRAAQGLAERRTLSMWLATIEPQRVVERARATLEHLQREADAELDRLRARALVLAASPGRAANDDAESAASDLEALAQRLAALERWVEAREAERQAALEPALGAAPGTDAAALQQWRSRVNRALQGYCQLSQVSHRLAWREAYVRLYYQCGIDAARRQRVRGTPTTIEVLTEQELRWLHSIVVQMAHEWQRNNVMQQA